VGWALLTLWFILTANFFLGRIMPGDPVALARSQRLSPAALDRQRELFGPTSRCWRSTSPAPDADRNLGVSIISSDRWSTVAGHI
jgi:ABC-type dipeptide/oligopeptide/nickel transport system permease component